MGRRLTAAEAAVVLRGPDDRQRDAVLRNLPPDVDPTLAADVLVSGLGDGKGVWGFARHFKKLPEPVIRALLQRLAERPDPASVFLRVYLADAPDLPAAWQRALYRLLSLDTTYAWGSKERRAKLTALAQEPRVVEALQAAVVANDVVRLDALAVLALDASEASVDALMPHFERAARAQDRGLDRLQALKKYASPTPAMTAMLKRVDALLAARNDASPALDLARRLGLGDLKAFWYRKYLGSTALNPFNVPVFQGSVGFDSREADWMHCSVSQMHPGGLRSGSTHFTATKVYADTLKLGRCAAEEVPAWLAAAAKTHAFTWNFDGSTPSSNLRGKKRDRVVEWLRTGK